MGTFQNLLTVDVGNTATSFGVFRIDRRKRRASPLSVWKLETGLVGKTHLLRRFLEKRAGNVHWAIVSSVVPRVDAPLRRILRKHTNTSPVFVTSKTQGAVRVRTKRPAEVGADRIVNARAVAALNRGPSIVIDFGTATTFDVVSSRAEYLGGVIAPGPLISAQALHQKTAKLPKVLLLRPAKILGKNTTESIQSGLYHGYRGLVKEIVKRLKITNKGKPKIFTTGGQSKWVLNGLHVMDTYVPHLTLLGLYHTWWDLRE